MNQVDYAPIYFEDCFTDEEFLKILELQDTFAFNKSTMFRSENTEFTLSDSEEYDDHRVSKSFWIPQDDEYKWIYDKISMYVNTANLEYQFDITYIKDRIQFTLYESELLGHYEWHNDIQPVLIEDTMRKLSVTVQLSDESEYEGGSFEFFRDLPEKIYAPKKKNTIIIFPSFLEHRIQHVTKGERLSLVLWYNGPKLK